MTGPIVAVTGATGFLGGYLVDRLAADGFAVRAIGRDRSRMDLPPGATWAHADITDAAELSNALDGVDVIYHAAAELDAPATIAQEYLRVNVGGTHNVLAAARDARVVVFSTIAVYGVGDGGDPFTEDSPVRPGSLYAISKLEAEGAARAAGAVCLRLAAVYGPGMTGNYVRMARAIARGRFVFVGDGTNRRTLVHVDDFYRAALAARHAPGGSVYNITDGCVHAFRDIAAAMACCAGRPVPRLRLPRRPVRAAVDMAHRAARLVGRTSPIVPANVDAMTADVAVSGHLFAAETGYVPQVDMATGWESVLRSEAAT
ncbi:MAG: NAD(P)-dependent oxidoreductase [Ilumatobacter sp.]|nr:NAD(P)-dependent oxidoreductase [Ilumatobacter sp.]